MNITLPDHLVGGTFASGASVHFTGECFVLDFIVLDNRKPDAAMVVSRVRLPPYTMQTLLQVLAGKLADYEAQYGKFPPDQGIITDSPMS